MSVHARVTDELRKLIPSIDGRVDGLSESGSYIQTFTDVATGKANLVCTPGGAFVIAGGKLKIVFDPDVPHDEKNTGVFLVSSSGSPIISVKAGGSLIENTPTRISGIIPELVAGKEWYVEVRTRYSGNSAKLLKEIRVIRSSFTLQQA
jgi:hypothetical protein